jgi:hypothetical protein
MIWLPLVSNLKGTQIKPRNRSLTCSWQAGGT